MGFIQIGRILLRPCLDQRTWRKSWKTEFSELKRFSHRFLSHRHQKSLWSFCPDPGVSLLLKSPKHLHSNIDNNKISFVLLTTPLLLFCSLMLLQIHSWYHTFIPFLLNSDQTHFFCSNNKVRDFSFVPDHFTISWELEWMW